MDCPNRLKRSISLGATVRKVQFDVPDWNLGSTFEHLLLPTPQIDWKTAPRCASGLFIQGFAAGVLSAQRRKPLSDCGHISEEFSKDEGEALYAEIEQRIQAEAEFKLHVHDVEWFSTYKVHSRHVSQFFREMLCRDAAHVHTPVARKG